ncbi:MAG: hypothetical protein JEZ04_16235 [Spirochaetales bacterium]|nr:hypothetical protein [Spirochaetales bacterium]
MDIESLIDGRIGDWLVKAGEMTENQVLTILQKQNDGDSRLFGEIAVDFDYIDIGSVIRYIEQGQS